ncbi:MAG: hypothetical protein KC457_22445, partial [Myxococcales bacterium]|nr:hypothetical protein [Myxococcales bacterium]
MKRLAPGLLWVFLALRLGAPAAAQVLAQGGLQRGRVDDPQVQEPVTVAQVLEDPLRRVSDLAIGPFDRGGHLLHGEGLTRPQHDQAVVVGSLLQSSQQRPRPVEIGQSLGRCQQV